VPVTEIREALGTTRKYALPLLASLDASGITRRRGDLRLAGARMAGVLAGAGRTNPSAVPAAVEGPSDGEESDEPNREGA
jgi:hypothetical protein